MYRLVRVTWIDAQSEDSWSNRDDIVNLSIPECSSVGYLIDEDRVKVSVAGTLGEDDQVCCTIQIPKGMILKIEDLAVIEPPEPEPVKRARKPRCKS